MVTQITRNMRNKGLSSAAAGGPSLQNGKPYRTKELKAEARSDAFRPNKGRSRGTYVSFVKRLEHGAPRVLQDTSNG